jgi:hypothetical protein
MNSDMKFSKDLNNLVFGKLTLEEKMDLSNTLFRQHQIKASPLELILACTLFMLGGVILGIALAHGYLI